MQKNCVLEEVCEELSDMRQSFDQGDQNWEACSLSTASCHRHLDMRLIITI